MSGAVGGWAAAYLHRPGSAGLQHRHLCGEDASNDSGTMKMARQQ